MKIISWNTPKESKASYGAGSGNIKFNLLSN